MAPGILKGGILPFPFDSPFTDVPCDRKRSTGGRTTSDEEIGAIASPTSSKTSPESCASEITSFSAAQAHRVFGGR